jgi:hypothetical protein
MRVVVSKNFSQQVGHSFVDFYAGGVITDEVLAGVLLKSGAPVEEVSDDNMMQCPHCRRASKTELTKERENKEPEKMGLNK